jgi:hypothetical protein
MQRGWQCRYMVRALCHLASYPRCVAVPRLRSYGCWPMLTLQPHRTGRDSGAQSSCSVNYFVRAILRGDGDIIRALDINELIHRFGHAPSPKHQQPCDNTDPTRYHDPSHVLRSTLCPIPYIPRPVPAAIRMVAANFIQLCHSATGQASTAANSTPPKNTQADPVLVFHPLIYYLPTACSPHDPTAYLGTPLCTACTARYRAACQWPDQCS